MKTFTFLVIVLLVFSSDLLGKPLMVCAELTTFDGPKASISVIRSDGTKQNAEFLEALYCGDHISVNQQNVSVYLEYTDGSNETITQANGLFKITNRGAAITPQVNMWVEFKKWLTYRNEHQRRSISSRGSPSIPVIQLVNMQRVKQVLSAGVRDIKVIWYGPKSSVIFQSLEGIDIQPKELILKSLGPNYYKMSVNAIKLAPGEYKLVLLKPDKQPYSTPVEIPFSVSNSLINKCKPIANSFPINTNKLLTLAQFAASDGGIHGWEAFNTIESLKHESPLRNIVLQALMAGEKLPWEKGQIITHTRGHGSC